MTKYNITACAVCNYPLGNDWKAEKVCPYCDTRYDLIHRKTDRSKTMISPSDCRHRHTILLGGSDGMGERHTATVCPDCGQLRVFGSKDGVTFDVKFELASDEAVAAAGKWNRLLIADEEHPTDKSHLYGPWMRHDA